MMNVHENLKRTYYCSTKQTLSNIIVSGLKACFDSGGKSENKQITIIVSIHTLFIFGLKL